MNISPMTPDYRSLIKLAILRDGSTRLDELMALMETHGYRISRLTVSAVARSFRQDMRLLDRLGLLHRRTERRAPKRAAARFYYDE